VQAQHCVELILGDVGGQGLAGEQGGAVQRLDLVVLGDHWRGVGVHDGEAVAEDLLLRRALGALGPTLDVVGQGLEHLLHVVPRLVPVQQRFAAELVLHGLQGIEQLGAGVEEALTCLVGDLEAQAQRAQHADAAIAEVGVVEHAAGLAVLHKRRVRG
jgi:hypothetical protein